MSTLKVLLADHILIPKGKGKLPMGATDITNTIAKSNDLLISGMPRHGSKISLHNLIVTDCNCL
jgi:hypothetical protein